nr:immunoglobulin light chain junction region [Macaca mulatta]MOX78908.1 immunoglobulin light chain junction region [Macaca mulatta]MOX80981.1 immunoglobulin light chain junction region [Macaca mulatta]MOX81256.1 immunoglobulin light chain junction region [Macaca mulatta]MOX82240.1 immunoglobulin light chain junction region [Macaca mulatta]
DYYCDSYAGSNTFIF